MTQCNLKRCLLSRTFCSTTKYNSVILECRGVAKAFGKCQCLGRSMHHDINAEHPRTALFWPLHVTWDDATAESQTSRPLGKALAKVAANVDLRWIHWSESEFHLNYASHVSSGLCLERQKTLTLDFRGRCSVASAKNFQLEAKWENIKATSQSAVVKKLELRHDKTLFLYHFPESQRFIPPRTTLYELIPLPDLSHWNMVSACIVFSLRSLWHMFLLALPSLANAKLFLVYLTACSCPSMSCSSTDSVANWCSISAVEMQSHNWSWIWFCALYTFVPQFRDPLQHSMLWHPIASLKN